MKRSRSNSVSLNSEDIITEGFTAKGWKMINMPKKSKYRMRAHINPLGNINFPVPFSPTYVDWSLHFPSAFGNEDNNGDKMYNNTGKYPITYEKDLKDTNIYQYESVEDKEWK